MIELSTFLQQVSEMFITPVSYGKKSRYNEGKCFETDVAGHAFSLRQIMRVDFMIIFL